MNPETLPPKVAAPEPSAAEKAEAAKVRAYHESSLGFCVNAWQFYLADPGTYAGPCVDILQEARLALPDEVVDLIGEGLATWPGFVEAVHAELYPDSEATPASLSAAFVVYSETTIEPFLEAEQGWPRGIAHPLPLIGLLAELAERAKYALEIETEMAHRLRYTNGIESLGASAEKEKARRNHLVLVLRVAQADARRSRISVFAAERALDHAEAGGTFGIAY